MRALVMLSALCLAVLASMVLLLAVVGALVTAAWGDECNPDLVSALTPKCQFLRPQFRQCRPDQDLDLDIDKLDNLCGPCPPGQFLEGFDFGTGLPICASACPAAATCPPPTVMIGRDGACGIVCSTNWCDPSPCLNGGQCVLSGNGFVCVCPVGCSGPLCATCLSTTTTSSTTTSSSAAPTTTSTSTSTSSSTSSTTSTSTSSTTTTSLALLPSTTFLDVPAHYLTGEAHQAFTPVAGNEMICGRFVTPTGITNATKAAMYLPVGSHSSQMGFAVYPDSDGGTALFRCNASGFLIPLQTCTGLTAFSLTAGTTYRVCACDCKDFSTNDQYLAPGWTPSTGWASEQSAFIISVGKAANLCTCATPPATTGAITQDNSLLPPELHLSVE